ncbi:hypothetical protein JGH11_18960 [Dysgonomonas sp. Marseille-P4677]|uniref:hypothetical protein n=1 Tax=Dysgonomonas sp. Marseille-P4677 TaxID=2364790 RepID=UPI0019138C74|nr:hypothetical protein [Dysgonomonas sp. Marseille-P4677]MBK5722954.1 hypothetical protein [Dysgonomonas sp. Marseille-P4677]
MERMAELQDVSMNSLPMKHGNILSILRRGNATIAGSPVVDNLTIAYNGNQMKKVMDATTTGVNGSMDIKDYSNSDIEYTYNTNGAMNKDLNKGISDIQYNSLNYQDYWILKVL